MEKELGASLLIREKRRFSLTPAGEYFYMRCKGLLKEVDDICYETSRIGRDAESVLRIGYLRCYSGQELYQAVADFSQVYPEVFIDIATGTHEELYNLLRHGGVDIILSDQRRAFSDDYVNYQLLSCSCYAELSARHPLSRQESVQLQDLKSVPCILISTKEQRRAELEYYEKTLNFGGSFLFAPTLEEGRHIQPDDSYAVLISKELADKNGLSVGDDITMYDLDSDSENTFEIVGIFSGTEGMSKDAMMADGIPANQGYIDMNSYNEIFDRDAMELGSLDVYVDSAENVQDVLETIQNLPEIKDKTFTYSTDTENFDLISNPLSSIQTMVDTAVIVIAVTGAAIIVLLLVLWTRGRKKEAGILMAVGRSKLEIVLQFLTENILIAIPAVAASFGLTALLADKVGAYLVSQTARDITGLNVTIHSADIAAVYGIGALILILAVLLAAVTVIRLKPREILSQMD